MVISMLSDVFKSYGVYSFELFFTFLNKLDSIKVDIIENDNDIYDVISYNGDLYKIKINKNHFCEWITINRYKGGKDLVEGFQFSFDPRNIELGRNADQFFSYSAVRYDNDVADIICSVYSFRDNNMLDGWQRIRKIDIEDSKPIVEHGNIFALTNMVDEREIKVYEKKLINDKNIKYFY